MKNIRKFCLVSLFLILLPIPIFAFTFSMDDIINGFGGSNGNGGGGIGGCGIGGGGIGCGGNGGGGNGGGGNGGGGNGGGGGGNTNLNYTFDAWDTFRDINDRNISTKLVAQEFKIVVASLNEEGSDYQEFNGTVCTCLDSDNCFKNLFEDANSSDQTTEGNPSFTLNDASDNIQVDIHWKKDSDTSCPLTDEDGTADSSDNFALRPEKFSFSLPQNQVYAGETFQIDFNATNTNDENSLNYNETKGTSFDINATILKAGCNIGTLEVADFSFSDGVASNIDTNYTNIGDLNITIQEKEDCSDRYASIDCDDKEVTNYWEIDKDLSIEAFSQVLNIKPYELNITVAEMNASTDVEWLYMANVNDMNLSLFAIVQANNKQHVKLDDFNATCYAEDVNLSFGVNVLNAENDLEMNATIIVNETTTKSDFQIVDINRTITITKDYFIAGEGNVSYFLNVDRNYSTPVNPFEIKDLNVTIPTTTVAKNENNSTDNNSSFIFYFARVATDDKETTNTSITHFSEIEVYDNNSSDYVTSFKQNSLKWYANAKHDDTFKSIIEINATKDSTLNSSSNDNITVLLLDTETGKVDFNISNPDSHKGTYRMHINIEPWFWYFPAGLGKEYNISNRSKCTAHPCFDYILKSTSTTSGVISGDFTGSDYNVSSRGTYERTGVKVFR
jgi:hypothetical protein